MSEFDEYIVHGEPGQKEKADAWQTAIGLQDVDGLKVSTHLLDTARQHIEGDITIDEARERIKAYYETKSGHDEGDDEGDKASANIVKILSEPSFAFSLVGLTSIHRRIFEGIFKFAGQLRNVELSKKEWVLGGKLPTAVFLIKYLRSMGIPATNDMFKAHSWYFRNALVRATYKGLNISPTTEFVERFLRNLILGEKNELRNRNMLVGASLPKSSSQSITTPNPKSQIDTLNCTLEEFAVLRVIEDNPKITQTEIAKSIKKSASTVKRITSSLVEKEILIRRNGRRNGWWEINYTWK